MIKVSIFYPKRPGSRFDADYYTKVHMPLAAQLLAPGSWPHRLKSAEPAQRRRSRRPSGQFAGSPASR